MQNRSFRITALENRFGAQFRGAAPGNSFGEQLWGAILDSFPDQLAASGSSNFGEQLSAALGQQLWRGDLVA